jgi:hypothetical protein
VDVGGAGSLGDARVLASKSLEQLIKLSVQFIAASEDTFVMGSQVSIADFALIPAFHILLLSGYPLPEQLLGTCRRTVSFMCMCRCHAFVGACRSAVTLTALSSPVHRLPRLLCVVCAGLDRAGGAAVRAVPATELCRRAATLAHREVDGLEWRPRRAHHRVIRGRFPCVFVRVYVHVCM